MGRVQNRQQGLPLPCGRAGVAQLEEQLTCNEQAVGSSPTSGLLEAHGFGGEEARKGFLARHRMPGSEEKSGPPPSVVVKGRRHLDPLVAVLPPALTQEAIAAVCSPEPVADLPDPGVDVPEQELSLQLGGHIDDFSRSGHFPQDPPRPENLHRRLKGIR
jgi:hypothetical protein